MKTTILALCALICCALPLAAQTTLTAKAPTHVATGDNFRLAYTVNTQKVGDDMKLPPLPEGLELISGPNISSQSSFQMVNGHTTSSSSITYNYIVYAAKEGTYTIQPASVTADGKKLQSKAVKITVSGEAPTNQATSQAASNSHYSYQGGAPRMHDDSNQPRMRDAGTQISNQDLFIQVSANKKRVHEQEPILLTYKVYTLVNLTQLEGKMPDLTGFHTQEIPLPQQKSFHVETVNGRQYRCVTWSQYVMYPQMTGKLEIPSITFNGVVMQQNRSVDPFEAFFNGGAGYVEVKRKITAPGMTIQVDPLPSRPADFSGGVGKMTIAASIDKTEVKANDPVTVRVTISGTGNLKLLKQPTVVFPKDFDTYDPNTTDKTRLTTHGVEGSMVYDFLAVPRNQGQYTIPAIEFIYYDTDANAYKTLTTEPLELTVKKGSGQANNVVDYSQPAVQDIHPIKTDSANSQRLDRLFFNSAAYWTLLLALLLAFAALLVIFRKRALDNANISKKRGKAANRIATKRLKIANRLMENNKNDQFYDEVLRALWGYVGDKLNLPVSQISKENIDGKLAARGIDSETIALFNRALDECEFNRYAPGDKQDTMRQTYHAAMTAIIKIEDMLKSLKKRKGAKVTAITMALLILCLSVNAQNGAQTAAQTADSSIKTSAVSATTTSVTAKNADSSTNDISDAVAAANHSYQQGNYQQAIASYEALLKREQRADLYYNLGNAYYQTDNITRAVINYERAMQLAPGDDDIRHNLQMATSKTIDKMTLRSEMIFVTWYKSLVFLLSIDAWARLALIALAAALLLLLLYLFATREQLRQWGFNSAALLIVVFLLCNLFAWQQKHSLSHCTRAVVITHTATLKTTPTANSEQKAVIHEGSAVDIKDDSMADWKLIELPDGRNGWVPTADLERI